MNQTIEINLKEILKACWRKLWIIVLCAVFVGSAVYTYTACCVTPMYKAKVTFYVNNSNYQGGNNNSISSSDLATAQRLVLTYVNIIKSDTVLEKVAQEADLDYTASQLRSMMTAESVGETEIFQMQIFHADPNMAALIANAIAAVAPNEISNILVGSSTKVVDYAKVPTAPYSPDRMRNALLGAIIGAVLVIIAIVVQVFVDVRIKSEDDLRRICDAPVLGVIPDFEEDTENRIFSKRRNK